MPYLTHRWDLESIFITQIPTFTIGTLPPYPNPPNKGGVLHFYAPTQRYAMQRGNIITSHEGPSHVATYFSGKKQSKEIYKLK